MKLLTHVNVLELKAIHIPGTENCKTVGSFSRNFKESIEWKLNGNRFQKVIFTL